MKLNEAISTGFKTGQRVTYRGREGVIWEVTYKPGTWYKPNREYTVKFYTKRPYTIDRIKEHEIMGDISRVATRQTDTEAVISPALHLAVNNGGAA